MIRSSGSRPALLSSLSRHRSGLQPSQAAAARRNVRPQKHRSRPLLKKSKPRPRRQKRLHQRLTPRLMTLRLPHQNKRQIATVSPRRARERKAPPPPNSNRLPLRLRRTRRKPEHHQQLRRLMAYWWRHSSPSSPSLQNSLPATTVTFLRTGSLEVAAQLATKSYEARAPSPQR